MKAIGRNVYGSMKGHQGLGASLLCYCAQIKYFHWSLDGQLTIILHIQDKNNHSCEGPSKGLFRNKCCHEKNDRNTSLHVSTRLQCSGSRAQQSHAGDLFPRCLHESTEHPQKNQVRWASLFLMVCMNSQHHLSSPPTDQKSEDF